MVAFSQVLAVLAALSANAAAWPEVVARQNSGSSTAASSASPGSTEPPASASRTRNAANTGDLNTAGRTDLPSPTAPSNATMTGSGNSTRPTSHQMFNPVDPPGGVNMIAPVTTQGTVLYRIGKTITFQWNYTSLQGAPTAVDVLVTASTASLKFTLTQNMSYEAPATLVWDTNKYQQSAVNKPLLTDEYSLIIYDSDTGPSAPAEAGYLAPFTGFKFGMYESQPYKNLSEYNCATCSAASRDLDRKAVGFAVAMATITVLSFTWFVTGIGGLP